MALNTLNPETWGLAPAVLLEPRLKHILQHTRIQFFPPARPGLDRALRARLSSPTVTLPSSYA